MITDNDVHSVNYGRGNLSKAEARKIGFCNEVTKVWDHPFKKILQYPFPS